ncbi:hypothetical protein [Arsukibacterium perlucidum]|uniref:hypothetical protein n=1 Tax=Arsukibacterium perlucidum TaxID=368811 RepID=UPI00036019E9|nr:hypothetical protein [Arsukibacterium perlucidum]
MEKLSPNVRQLYRWLQQGNFIELCTHAGRYIGQIRTIGTTQPNGLRAAFNTLYQYGLLKETEFFEYGIRWSRFTAKTDTGGEVQLG